MVSLVKSISFENSLKYLLFLCPLFIILGPAPTNIFMSCFFLITLLWKYKEKFVIKFKDYEILLFIFFLYILLSNVISLNFDGLIKVILFLTFFISLLITKNIKNFLFFFKNKSILFLLLFIFLIFDASFQFFFGFNILGINMADGARVSSFFGKEAILGSFLAKFSLIFYCLLIYTSDHFKLHIFFKWLLIILYFLIIFLSGERVSFVFSILLLVIYFIKIKEFKKILITVLTTIILFLSVFNINFFVNYKNIYIKFIADIGIIKKISEEHSTQKTIDRAQRLYIIKNTNENNTIKPQVKNNLSTSLGIPLERYDQLINNKRLKINYFMESYHGGLFLNSIFIFKDNIFFGIGIDKYKSLCKNGIYKKDDNFYLLRCSNHPHNIYLELLVETGIVGFLIFILFLFYYFRFLFKKSLYLKDRLFDAILITNIGLFFPFIITGSFFSSGYFIFFYFYIILASVYGGHKDAK